MITILNVVMVSQVCTYVETYQIVHFMCVNYSLIKLRTLNLFDAINSLLLNCFKCDNDYI